MTVLKKSKIILILLMVMFLCGLSSCKEDNINLEMKQWLAQADLNSKQSTRELYTSALKEDTLVIYSETTRVLDVAKSFMDEYPGLTVSVIDVRATDMTGMLLDNYENKNFICDLVIRNDNDGIISNELMPKGIVYKYVPFDIDKKIIYKEKNSTLPIVTEVQMLVYNNEIFDKPPISNWWEIIEPKWKGKVVIANPMRSITSFAFFSMLVKNEELLRNSYENFYGFALDLPKEDNAGEYFIKKLVENGLIVTNSSDEVAGMVGEPSITNPMIGIMISSKIRLNNIGYNLELIYNLKPFCGVYLPNSISVVGGAKNINSSKLFIRYILGETDGKGEGNKPYLQNGAWSVRKDVESETRISIDFLDTILVDSDYVYKNTKKIKDFWLSLQ